MAVRIFSESEQSAGINEAMSWLLGERLETSSESLPLTSWFENSESACEIGVSTVASSRLDKPTVSSDSEFSERFEN